MGLRVFISHASENSAVAEKICAGLEAHGAGCWIAPRNIVPGADWSTSIIKAIAEARVMVIVVSERACKSQNVAREVERAAFHKIPLLPFRIDRTPLSDSLEYFLSAAHWLDATGLKSEESTRHLVASIRVLAPEVFQGGPEPQPPKPEPKPLRPPAPRPQPKPPTGGLLRFLRLSPGKAIALAVGLMALFIAAYLIDSNVIELRQRVNDAVLSPDGTTIASVYGQGFGVRGTLRLWNMQGEAIRTIPVSNTPVWKLAWSPDGSVLATGNFDGTVNFWNAASWQPMKSFKTNGMVQKLAWDGSTRLYVGSYFASKSFVTLWSVKDGVQISEFGTSAWDAASGWLASVGTSGTSIQITNGSDPDAAPTATLENPSSVLSLEWSRDARLLLAVGNDSKVHLWDRSRRQYLRAIEGSEPFFSPDGKRLVTRVDTTATIWDIATGRIVRTIGIATGTILGWPAPNRLCIQDFHDLKLWDPDSGSLAFDLHVSALHALFSF